MESPNTSPDTLDSEFDNSRPPPEGVEERLDDPPPELVEALKRHYALKRGDLQRQIADMESLLGFIDVSGELAVRVAKLEAFLGVKA